MGGLQDSEGTEAGTLCSLASGKLWSLVLLLFFPSCLFGMRLCPASENGN